MFWSVDLAGCTLQSCESKGAESDRMGTNRSQSDRDRASPGVARTLSRLVAGSGNGGGELSGGHLVDIGNLLKQKQVTALDVGRLTDDLS